MEPKCSCVLSHRGYTRSESRCSTCTPSVMTGRAQWNRISNVVVSCHHSSAVSGNDVYSGHGCGRDNQKVSRLDLELRGERPSFLPSVSLLALDLSSLAPLPRYMENLLYLPAIFIPRHPCPVVGPRLSTPLNYTYTGSRKRRNVIKRDFAPFRGDIRVSIRGNGFFRGIL